MARYRSTSDRRVKRDAQSREKVFNGLVVGVNKTGQKTYEIKLVGLSKEVVLHSVKSAVKEDLFEGDGCIINFMGRGKTQPYIVAISYCGADSEDSGKRAETGVFDSSDFDNSVFE